MSRGTSWHEYLAMRAQGQACGNCPGRPHPRPAPATTGPNHPQRLMHGRNRTSANSEVSNLASVNHPPHNTTRVHFDPDRLIPKHQYRLKHSMCPTRLSGAPRVGCLRGRTHRDNALPQGRPHPAHRGNGRGWGERSLRALKPPSLLLAILVAAASQSQRELQGLSQGAQTQEGATDGPCPRPRTCPQDLLRRTGPGSDARAT